MVPGKSLRNELEGCMQKKIEQYFAGHLETMEIVSSQMAPAISDCVTLLVTALRAGKKVLVMGNGGSAADAQHFAAELVGRFLKNRRALPAVALTTDTSILTAVGNDFGFDEIFKRQVEALAADGDVVLGISTSGHSNNVFHALTTANAIGCKTVGLLGRDGGNIAGIVDLALTIPVQETPHIQEAHITILHLLCAMVEQEIFS
jgi:D-sedoheptulose 7-phosphate isomerase